MLVQGTGFNWPTRSFPDSFLPSVYKLKAALDRLAEFLLVYQQG